MPFEQPPPTPILSHPALPGCTAAPSHPTTRDMSADPSEDWDCKAILTAQNQLSILLTTMKSHGAKPPRQNDERSVSASFRHFPHRDFTDLTQQIKELNPHLKTFSRQLIMSMNPVNGYTWSPSQVVGRHADTLSEILNIDTDTLRDAHKAITLTDGCILLSEKHKLIRSSSTGWR